MTAGGIGYYCFRAVYDPGNDPNYQSSAGIFDGSATELVPVGLVARQPGHLFAAAAHHADVFWHRDTLPAKLLVDQPSQ